MAAEHTSPAKADSTWIKYLNNQQDEREEEKNTNKYKVCGFASVASPQEIKRFRLTLKETDVLVSSDPAETLTSPEQLVSSAQPITASDVGLLGGRRCFLVFAPLHRRQTLSGKRVTVKRGGGADATRPIPLCCRSAGPTEP